MPKAIEPMPIQDAAKPGSKQTDKRNKPMIGVTVSNLYARWGGSNAEIQTLENVSLKVGQGQLVAVVGSVGAGKVSIKYMASTF